MYLTLSLCFCVPSPHPISNIPFHTGRSFLVVDVGCQWESLCDALVGVVVKTVLHVQLISGAHAVADL